MVPGMAHCGGGIGPIVDAMTAIINWVEKAGAGDDGGEQGRGERVVRTGDKLCAYPQVARHTKHGQHRRRRTSAGGPDPGGLKPRPAGSGSDEPAARRAD
jgi:hypothetical protein